jgi:crotonobetainyl-CoA:carnitine CoA-transferase CaiB-like acyl-CoA transferase
VLVKLLQSADVLIENSPPARGQGVGPEHLEKINPRLVYCALKGFLPGPYEKRPALDEVVQMMGGLAYMTGPSGRPLRAGTSVVDIVGGLFGAFGTVLALKQRERTGKGGLVESALFESVVFLMGQHLAITAMNGAPPPPMPERVSSWAIYEIFNTRDGQQIFIGITSDGQWKRFCEVFRQPGLAADPQLATNQRLRRGLAGAWGGRDLQEPDQGRYRDAGARGRHSVAMASRGTCSIIRTCWQRLAGADHAARVKTRLPLRRSDVGRRRRRSTSADHRPAQRLVLAEIV